MRRRKRYGRKRRSMVRNSIRRRGRRVRRLRPGKVGFRL
jgi:hypothetical protein